MPSGPQPPVSQFGDSRCPSPERLDVEIFLFVGFPLSAAIYRKPFALSFQALFSRTLQTELELNSQISLALNSPNSQDLNSPNTLDLNSLNTLFPQCRYYANSLLFQQLEGLGTVDLSLYLFTFPPFFGVRKKARSFSPAVILGVLIAFESCRSSSSFQSHPQTFSHGIWISRSSLWPLSCVLKGLGSLRSFPRRPTARR